MDTVFGFFLVRFPRIPPEEWRGRFLNGKVWTSDRVLDLDSPYDPLTEVHYHRESRHEPPVRTDIRVVWQDEHLLIVDKPPFLPVTPGGAWVQGCLLNLLIYQRSEPDLSPLHRLDRLTSGLVILSRRALSRGHYSMLFQGSSPVLEKTYTAVCEVSDTPPPQRATLEHHITRSPSQYHRQTVVPERPANARLELELLDHAGNLALLRVRPLTGRKHQIRVQLAAAGLPILGDPLYGRRPRHDPFDLNTRLWLDAHRIVVTGFAGWQDAPLVGEWLSSRPPAGFLHRALAAHQSTPPPGDAPERTRRS